MQIDTRYKSIVSNDYALSTSIVSYYIATVSMLHFITNSFQNKFAIYKWKDWSLIAILHECSNSNITCKLCQVFHLFSSFFKH